ncbi:MAG: hypothetical protein ABFS05_12560 [Bacteroidota bacterium]
MYNVNFKVKGLLLLLIMAFVIVSCKKDETYEPLIPADHERGEIVEMKSMGLFTKDDVQQFLDESGADFEFCLNLTVEAFSVKYYTIDHKGNDILVSGALFVPQERALAMMSIQHGTITKRDQVASVSPENSTEGIIGMLTASMGYITLVPDYPGFGASNLSHPYLHAASIVPSVIDFIIAAQAYCSENDIMYKDQLFLTGYSEGGFVSLMAQKTIEESYQGEIELTAVAPLAGPYDLQNTFDKIFQEVSYSTPAYVAYLLSAYNDVYHWNSLDKFFKAPYASMMPDLFDGSKSWSEVVNSLPTTLSELIHPGFIANYYDKKESMVWDAMKDNTLLDWTPQTPIHFFHGDCDDVVFCINAINALDAFLGNGAYDVQLTILEGVDHETAGPYAITGAIGWIEDFHPDM